MWLYSNKPTNHSIIEASHTKDCGISRPHDEGSQSRAIGAQAALCRAAMDGDVHRIVQKGFRQNVE